MRPIILPLLQTRRCEPNYELTRFIAEPANTISNLSFVLLGLIGAYHEFLEKSKRSYIVMYLTVTAIGIGSMLFHGTLTVWGQQLDELPMVWHLLGCMYVVNREAIGTSNQIKATVSALLLLYAAVFSIFHIIFRTTTAFQVHFGALLGLLLARVAQRFRLVDPGDQGRQVIRLFVGSGLVAFACWLIDYHGCEFVLKNLRPFGMDPHGHVFWHLFMGYSAFCSVVMLKVLEEIQGGKNVEVRYVFGLPFAYRVHKEASADKLNDLF